MGRKTYVSISGFLRQFCGRFSKVKIHLPMVRIAFFSVLSAHPRSCRPFPPQQRQTSLFLPLGEFLVLPHPSHNRKQPKLRVLVGIDARCGRCVFFCPFDGGQVRDVRSNCCLFSEPWKWLGSSVLVSETHGNIACC